jgi:hypothetical protein
MHQKLRHQLNIHKISGNSYNGTTKLCILHTVCILASFCVWKKSLKCKDAVNRDSTIQMSADSACKSEEFQVPCQPYGRSSHPVRTPIYPLFHPSGRRVYRLDRQDRSASYVRTKCSFHLDPILYREVSVPACIRPDISAECLDAS